MDSLLLNRDQSLWLKGRWEELPARWGTGKAPDTKVILKHTASVLAGMPLKS